MTKRNRESKPKRKTSLEFTGALRVSMVQPGPVMTTPYWTPKNKVPCAPYTKGRNRCWKDEARSDEFELEKYSKKACTQAGGVFEEAAQRSLEPGRVELDFISEAQARKYGVRAGPILRLCHTANTPGALMPVESPLSAKDKSSSFNACIARKVPSIAQECSGEVAGKNAPLGALTSRRAFAGLLGW